MGASQSKLPEPVIEEKLLERLRALEVRESRVESEKDYVYLDDQKTPQKSYSPTVSISTTEQWEKELLDDPKVAFELTIHGTKTDDNDIESIGFISAVFEQCRLHLDAAFSCSCGHAKIQHTN